MDFFSDGVVGTNAMDALFIKIKHAFPDSTLEKLNLESENLSWIRGVLVHNGEAIKVEFIQNIGLLHEVERIDDIPLIDDRDIGSLKLEAAANRGTKKDFYDLFLLSQGQDIKSLHDDYLKRRELFDGHAEPNIFNASRDTKARELAKDLTSLLNFNNTKDLKSPNNKIQLTANSPITKSWFDIQLHWKNKVESLGLEKGLKVGAVENIPVRRRKSRGRGFKL